MTRRRHPPYLPVTSYAHNAAHDDRVLSRCVACPDHSHGKAATIPGLVSPVGAMPCRKSAVGDLIGADFLSARPRQSDRANKEELLPQPLSSRNRVGRGERIDPLQAASFAVVCWPAPVRSPGGSGKGTGTCLSSTKSAGPSERSCSAGCILPASARFGSSGTLNEADGASGERNVGRKQG
jgi:hypothetical protein